MNEQNNNDFPVKENACGCGGNHDHENDYESELVTVTLEDGTEIECPVIDFLVIDEQEYIALFNPIDETALLYRYDEFDDETFEITSIESDEEFERVQEEMFKLMEEE